MIPIMVMWNGNNIGGSAKRGVGIAIQIGFGNCGGVIGSFMYVIVPNFYISEPKHPNIHLQLPKPR
jgi:hypothetical protein